MKYTVKYTSRFKKEYKNAIKRNLPISLLDDIVKMLAKGETLPEKKL